MIFHFEPNFRKSIESAILTSYEFNPSKLIVLTNNSISFEDESIVPSIEKLIEFYNEYYLDFEQIQKRCKYYKCRYCDFYFEVKFQRKGIIHCSHCDEHYSMRPCGNGECSVTTNVADILDFGSGDLSDNGFWENPCYVCARWFEFKSILEGNLEENCPLPREKTKFAFECMQT